MVKLAATSGLRAIPDTAAGATFLGKYLGYMGTNLSPALLGVGYIGGRIIGLVGLSGSILSWLIAFNVINTHNDFVRQIWGALDRMTEPMYRPIRRILPEFGGLDLSPLVVLVGLAITDRILVEIQYSYYVM